MLLEFNETQIEEILEENGLKATFSPAFDRSIKTVNICIEGIFTYKNLDTIIEKMNYYLLRYQVLYITLKSIERIDASAVDYLVNLIKEERYRTIVIEGFLSAKEKAMFHTDHLLELPYHKN